MKIKLEYGSLGLFSIMCQNNIMDIGTIYVCGPFILQIFKEKLGIIS